MAFGNTSQIDASVVDISVIVPVYNRERLLPMMLNSLARQSVRPREVIFIDNNSTDATPAILNCWKNEKESQGWNVKILNVSERGAALARRKGEDMATSTYLSFFDSDDVMHPDFLEKAMADFEANPGLDMTVWNVTFVHPDGRKRNRRVHPRRPLENHLIQGLLSTQAYTVRRDFLRKAGGWNPKIGGWDDLELGLRLLLAAPVIKITDESRVDVTVQEDSISGMSFLHRKGDWEHTLNEMAAMLKSREHEIDASKYQYISRILAYRFANLAAHYYREGDRDGAHQLLNDIKNRKDLGFYTRQIIRAAYRFTSIGLPGAGAFFPPLLR